MRRAFLLKFSHYWRPEKPASGLCKVNSGHWEQAGSGREQRALQECSGFVATWKTSLPRDEHVSIAAGGHHTDEQLKAIEWQEVERQTTGLHGPGPCEIKFSATDIFLTSGFPSRCKQGSNSISKWLPTCCVKKEWDRSLLLGADMFPCMHGSSLAKADAHLGGTNLKLGQRYSCWKPCRRGQPTQWVKSYPLPYIQGRHPTGRQQFLQIRTSHVWLVYKMSGA